MYSLKSIKFCHSLPETIASKSRLRVHSVFHHACNLVTSQGDMISLQAQNLPLAPCSANLPLNDFRMMFKQDTWLPLLNDNTLMLNLLRIELTAGKSVSTKLENGLPHEILPSLAAKIEKFIVQNPPSGGIYEVLERNGGFYHPEMLIHISEALAHLRTWLISADMVLDVNKTLCQLIGFGIGLTPSADDFILGLLLILNYCNYCKFRKISLLLPSILTKTTDISAAMLARGCDGYYSHHFSSLLTSPIEEIDKTLTYLVKYGHSSGHDMLCGAHFALTALYP